LTLLQIDKIIGNVNFDKNLRSKFENMSKYDRVETVNISRLESERIRMRKVSDRGTELALTLSPGSHLIDGDVIFLTDEKIIVVRRTVENVLVISLHKDIPKDRILEVAIKIGHKIGNMHRPIKILGEQIFFPIQSNSELELFEKFFFSFRNNLDISKDNIIFEPDAGYNIHEH
jgi:urease accessory protein